MKIRTHFWLFRSFIFPPWLASTKHVTKTAVETIEALRYKVRMFDIPVKVPDNVYCDNEAVTKNTTIPEPKIKE